MRRGFTLLELVIVLAITIMLSALSISYKSSTQRQIGLYVEVQKMAEMILRAKSLAVATYNDPDASPDGSKVICGYGVEIDYQRSLYSLFSYRVPAGNSCEEITNISNSPPNEILVLSSHSSLPGVVLDESFPGETKTIYKVFFVPPDPITLIATASGGTVSRRDGRIHLNSLDGGLNSVIYISSVGQVDF